MDGFDAALEDLDDAMKRLHGLVQSVIVAPSLPEKKEVEMSARPVFREARSKLSALRAETRRTTDATTRAAREGICRDHDDRIRNYESGVKEQIYPSRQAPAPTTFQKSRESELMGAGGAGGTGFTSATQVLEAATNVQNDALEAIARTERLQHVTEETGKSTLLTLQRQTEQMYQIDEELEDLQGQLDHASRDLRWFYRQMAGDKCFLMIFAVLILSLLALVFISIYTKRRR